MPLAHRSGRDHASVTGLRALSAASRWKQLLPQSSMEACTSNRPCGSRLISEDPANHRGNNKETPVLTFYFNGSPNRARLLFSLRKPVLPMTRSRSTPGAADQFKPEFLAINPNGKVPGHCRRRCDRLRQQRHPALPREKTGKFLPPETPANRGALLSWLMFVATGVGPFSGQAVHFKHFAPEKVPYAHDRYQYEAMRHYSVLDQHLAKAPLHGGDTYTIVDMDIWAGADDPVHPWRGCLGQIAQSQAAVQ